MWLVCLFFAGLTLAGCFHIPDEDWLPSKNKIDTWNVEGSDEIQQAMSSFMEKIDLISSQKKEGKNNEKEEVSAEKLNETIVGTGSEAVNNENTGWETKNIISGEEK